MKFSTRFPVAALTAVFLIVSPPAGAQVTAYKQAVAEATYGDDQLGAFYRLSGYAPVWTGADDLHRARRAALLNALRGVDLHGLPASRYDVDALLTQMGAARTTRDMGLVEVALSRAFLKYARDVKSGILVPARIDKGIVRKIRRPDGTALLNQIAGSTDPADVLNSLPPANAEYRHLIKEKMRLEQVVADGSWGPSVNTRKLEPGDRGAAVVALRNRLIAMGYMQRSAVSIYGPQLEAAVRDFQSAHGLEVDGVAGPGTIKELNRPARDRLKSVIVAMERERWTNFDRGDRHILVNQTDFSAQVIDHGHVTFKTRAVIGKNVHDQRSPEFSDVMEHMIINPSWHVPRSIMTKEYLPQLQADPTSVSHLIITDRSGRQVSRAEADFSEFTETHFPFDMRQPPGARNALGKVKFMFPNKHNIYLHDTPHKSLFKREVRAYSHGCIRLADPFDFAYTLLSPQSEDPQGQFQSILRTGRETKVDLEQPVPVHLIYRTAVISPRGKAEFRRDIYGRDGKIWDALSRSGVALSGVQG